MIRRHTHIQYSSVVLAIALSVVCWGNHSLPVLADDSATTTPDIVTTDSTTTLLLAAQPRIRVGLLKPSGAVVVVSHSDDYRIVVGTDEVGILLLGKSATLSRKDGRFVFSSSDLSFSTSTYLRLEPVHDEHAIIELSSIIRRVPGKGKINFNTYRGALEYRMTKKGDALYLINDVAIEDYVAGVAETSPTAPVEYMKAMAVAARTYAYVTAATAKHDRQYFDVLASTADQLYLGYESERSMARVTEATVATHGMMVTYGGVPVVTPYFAHSNGHTRSWQSVWGGSSHPWLVAVTTTYDAARFKKRSGHGVGMSGYDASTRAKREVIDYIALLKYYYTGVDVEQIYE